MPQNLKTEPNQYNDKRELDAQELKFVEALGQTNNQTDAYAQAYGAGNYSRAALRVQACRKAAEPHIKAALSELRAAGLANATITIQDRVEAMLAKAQRSEDAGNWGASLGYDKEVNELMGFKIERIADVSAHLDPIATLKQIAQTSPEYAEELAKQHNIPWTPTPVGQGERVH